MSHGDALIGASGFVGGNLARQKRFSGLYNSRNVHEAGETRHGLVVCAAAPGSMLLANREPEKDEAHIRALCDQLDRLRADRFVLISSIAVLQDFAGGDDETTTRFQTDLAYGRNRRRLEAFCADRFRDCLIIRLPALFGPGLKKNFLFDLLNPVPTLLMPERYRWAVERMGPAGAALGEVYGWNAASNAHVVDRAALAADAGRHRAIRNGLARIGLDAVGFTNPASTYQFYNLDRLWADAEAGLAAGLPILHLAPQPLGASAVHERLTGRPMPESGARVHHEDMRSIHAGLFGRTDAYRDDADRVLEEIAAFFRRERPAP